MITKTKGGKCRIWGWFGAMVLSIAAAPIAVAGPAEDTEQARKEFEAGNLTVAMALWKKTAEQGYAPAQVWLADILDKAEENEEAVSWYQKAADQGNVAGEYGLGQMYAKGEGVAQDFGKARAYVLRAAEKSHLPAVVTLREIYKNGVWGVAVDLAQSAKWRAKAEEIDPKLKAAAQKEEKTTPKGRRRGAKKQESNKEVEEK